MSTTSCYKIATHLIGSCFPLLWLLQLCFSLCSIL
jgi:hypothetical protein